MAPLLHIHIDLDNLWALGECYGIDVPKDKRYTLLLNSIPTLLDLFRDLKISATFFVVGADLESEDVVTLLRQALAEGHHLANHSMHHPLNFRALSHATVENEIVECHQRLTDAFGVPILGFRAPGYAYRDDLAQILKHLNYRYDSSLMPSWGGPVLRFLDRRIQAGKVSPEKTQFPTLRDWLNPITPYLLAPDLLEFPVATSAWLRLAFQAGVCLNLPAPYFHLNHGLSRNTPLIFLIHAADVADFRNLGVDWFAKSSAFKRPAEEQVAKLRHYLQALMQTHQATSLEAVLTSPESATPYPT